MKKVWLEEYGKCGCTNVTKTKSGALGYCPVHGNDAIHMYEIDGKGAKLGYAG